MAQSPINKDQTFLEQAPARMSMLLNQHWQALKALRAEREYLMPRDYDRRVQAQHADYQRQVTQLEQQCHAARMRLTDIARIAAGESGRHQDSARALNTRAAWERLRPILERQGDYMKLVARAREAIAEAGRTGDLATLRAIREEMPAFLEAHEPADQLARRTNAGQTFAQYDHITQMLLAEVHQQGASFLPPEEQMAYEITQQLSRYDSAITGNFERLKEAATNPNQALIGLLGWQKDHYIPPGFDHEVPNDDLPPTTSIGIDLDK